MWNNILTINGYTLCDVKQNEHIPDKSFHLSAQKNGKAKLSVHDHGLEYPYLIERFMTIEDGEKRLNDLVGANSYVRIEEYDSRIEKSNTWTTIIYLECYLHEDDDTHYKGYGSMQLQRDENGKGKVVCYDNQCTLNSYPNSEVFDSVDIAKEKFEEIRNRGKYAKFERLV